MIGIYDSGIGGISILNAIYKILPQEQFKYFGETKYCPFGDRSHEEIKDITLTGLKKLAEECDLIVIACNTASVNDLDSYREAIDKPIIGVVPVIKTAAQITNSDFIALLATQYTNTASYTDDLINEFAVDKKVKKISCKGLVDAIEEDDNNRQDKLLKEYLIDMDDTDVIVLGCTHYSLIKGKIQNIVGPDVKVIDSAEAVARQTLKVLRENNLEKPQGKPEVKFECSGDKEVFMKMVKKYFCDNTCC